MSIFIASTGFGLVTASILAISAVGFTLQWGVSRILNLAYVDFMILTAYLDYTLSQQAHIGFWPSAVLSVLAVAVLSVVFNRFLLQPFARRGVRFFYLLIVAFSVGIVVQYAIQTIWGTTFFNISVGGNTTYSLGSFQLTLSQIVIIAIAVAAMLGVHLLLTRTDFGRALRAVSMNESLAQCSGIRTSAVLDGCWFLSGLLCGLGGLVLAFNTSTFDANTGVALLSELLAAVVLGGVGSVYGAMLGALIIGIVSEWATGLINPYFDVVVALIALVAALLFRPEGLIRSLTEASGGGT